MNRTLLALPILLLSLNVHADPLPPDTTYRPLPTAPLDAVIKSDRAAKPAVLQRQQALLAQRYDLADKPIPGVKMSGGRKTVQGGVRVRLPQGVTWDRLASMTPEDIRAQGAFPAGFLRLPHVKQSAGGQVFPKEQIDEINNQEKRSLERFDVDSPLGHSHGQLICLTGVAEVGESREDRAFRGDALLGE